MKKTVSLLFCMMILLGPVVFADGLIILTQPAGSRVQSLEVRYHHVSVDIKDLAAVTSVDQEFYNPNGARVEGEYLFPIPSGAVINKFSMYIDGKETPAELLDAAKAKRIYEDIVRRQRDPALLEYSGNGLFRARVFPIEARGTKRIKISYTEVLSRDNGTVEYRYPLNTEKFSSKPVGDIKVDVRIDSTGIGSVICPTHDAEIIKRGADHARVSYEAHDALPDTDFRVYYSTTEKGPGFSMLTYGEPGLDGKNFFLMNICPVNGTNISKSVIGPKDVCFVLDTSGSMKDKKLDQAKAALVYCLKHLGEGDRFDIIRFSTEAESLFGGLVDADKAHVDEALAEVAGFSAIGGTAIEDALKLALDSDKRDGIPGFMVFITDGKPTIGMTENAQLLQMLSARRSAGDSTRIFTFGIGEDLDTRLLDGITELTRACRSYIGAGEDITRRISDFFDKISFPVLTDITLRVEGGVKFLQSYPDPMPDLFHGSSLTVIGQYKGTGRAKVILEGFNAGHKVSFPFEFDVNGESNGNDFIPALWATRRIGRLLDHIRLKGEERELVEEVTFLARKYGIVTPYTSYLILEDEAVRVSRNELAPRFQTLPNAAPEMSLKKQALKSGYREMRQESGAASVHASVELQDMSGTGNMGKVRQKSFESVMNGSSKSDTRSMMRNVAGRTFYNSNGVWMDPMAQADSGRGQVTRLIFGSDEYFDLLRDRPSSAQYMSLGRNVRFLLDGRIYEVTE